MQVMQAQKFVFCELFLRTVLLDEQIRVMAESKEKDGGDKKRRKKEEVQSVCVIEGRERENVQGKSVPSGCKR
jgi:hypothetical protein